MSVSISNSVQLYKNWYTGQKVEQLAFPESAILAKLKKSKVGGRAVTYAMKYGYNAGASGDLSVAIEQAQNLTARSVELTLKTYKDYAAVSVETQAARAAENVKGAYENLVKGSLNDALQVLGVRMSLDFFSNGFAKLGKVATGGISGSTIQLETPTDWIHFPEGKQVQFAQDDASALRDSGDYLTVTGVTEDGLITFSSAVSGVSGAQAGDTMYGRGDRPTGAAAAPTRALGCDFWCPLTAPSAGVDATGVDRSANVFLRGPVANLTTIGGSELDAVVKVAAIQKFRGVKTEMIVMHPLRYERLCIDLQGQNRYVPTSTKGAYGIVSFSGIKVATNSGEVEVYEDRDCDVLDVWGFNTTQMELISLGDMPGILDDDGKVLCRGATADTLEARAGGYWNVKLNHAAAIARVRLPAIS